MSSSITLRGIRTGTPVPRVDEDATKPGPVTTYQAPPEMLERYRAMGSKRPKQTRISTFGEEQAARRIQKGESEMSLSLTKDEYLDMRRSGKTRSQIARALNLPHMAYLYPQLEKWGIRDTAVELAEMDNASSAPDVRMTDVPSKPVPFTAEPPSVQSPAENIQPVIQDDTEPELAKTTDIIPENIHEPASVDLSDVMWISPGAAPKEDALVRINKSGIRLGLWAAQKLKGASHVEVGIKPGTIIVRPSSSGWRVQAHKDLTGVYFGSNRLVAALERIGFRRECSVDAMWNKDLGVLVVTMTEGKEASNVGRRAQA